jgi:hypothetical protein
MKGPFFTILICFSVLFCFSQTLRKQTTAKDTIHKTSPPKHLAEDDDPEPSLATILSDQLKSYKHVVKIDTTFLLSPHDTLTVKLRHYCVYDDDIDLPSNWIKMYNLKKFRAHNFVTALTMKLNNSVVFNGLIKKKDFNELLDNNLKKYAVLLVPAIKASSNGLMLGYSISVPLADIGHEFTMNIDTLGNKHVSK